MKNINISKKKVVVISILPLMLGIIALTVVTALFPSMFVIDSGIPLSGIPYHGFPVAWTTSITNWNTFVVSLSNTYLMIGFILDIIFWFMLALLFEVIVLQRKVIFSWGK